MTDTSVDLEQVRSTAQLIRDIAEGDLTALINAHPELLEEYRKEASANTLDGAPAGIYLDTAAVLESGLHDASTKIQAVKKDLLNIAEKMEEHARGVESDEAESAQRLHASSANL
ncbi:hypothetical protein [Mycobacteroides abscessus]|jgi:hypothetical protein|uniref:hypothetical protein n=1 Tax=Mycobacteroides abscessus TaxID=36809 RepID=UPI0018964DC9